MIPTVLLDPATVFLTGTILALVWRRLLLLRGEAELERLTLVGAGAGLWYGITLGYVFFAYPDWMLVYLQDGAQLYKPVGYVAFVVTLVAAGAAGVASTGWLLLRGRGRWAWGMAGAAALGLAAIWRISWRQYWAVGSTTEWVASQYRALGQAAEAVNSAPRPLMEFPEFQTVMNVTMGLNFLAIVALLGWRWWLGRKAPAAPAAPPPAA